MEGSIEDDGEEREGWWRCLFSIWVRNLTRSIGDDDEEAIVEI